MKEPRSFSLIVKIAAAALYTACSLAFARWKNSSDMKLTGDSPVATSCRARARFQSQ